MCKCRISDVMCFSLLGCRFLVWDRAVVGRLYRISVSVESAQSSLFFEVLVTVFGSLEARHGTSSLESAAVLFCSQHTVYEGKMTKTASKEKGKGPGRGKGRPLGG